MTSPIILDGRATSKQIKEEIADKVADMVADGDKAPHLAAVLVGSDGASRTYVNAKVKACEAIGFKSSLVELDESISEQELLNEVSKLNANPDIDGFIVQVPLPNHIDQQKVTLAIDPAKDVDGFHPENLGKLVLGLPTYISATPNGILELLKRYNVETEGKHCVVMGRSHIVGAPMSILMGQKKNPGNCTVTLVHSRTKNIGQITKSADIIIVAIGKPEFLKADMVKEGAVVIDVGIHRIEDSTKKSGFRLLGDVAYDEVAPKCSFISPVPGGVGPMTIASLLLNTLQAATNKPKIENLKS